MAFSSAIHKNRLCSCANFWAARANFEVGWDREKFYTHLWAVEILPNLPLTMVFDGCAPSVRRWNGYVPSLKSRDIDQKVSDMGPL